MRLSIIFILFTILSLSLTNVYGVKTKPNYRSKSLRTLFNEFKKKYKRHYKDHHQENERYLVFKDNVKMIKKANDDPAVKSYQEIGPFSDMKPEEFVKYQDGLRSAPGSQDYVWRASNHLRSVMDFRRSGGQPNKGVYFIKH